MKKSLVLEKWPLDAPKKGKDIGEAIREQNILINFKLFLTNHFWQSLFYRLLKLDKGTVSVA